MKKFVIRAALGLAIIFIGLFLFLCVEHFRGKSALRSHLQQLTAQGEKLSISDNLPPQIPPDQNAATDLFALTNELQNLSHTSTSAPPIMKIVAPGRALAGWQLSSWAISDKESNTWTHFKTEIQPARATLEKLQSIWHKPGADDGFHYSNSFIDYTTPTLLVKSKQTAQLLSAATAADLYANDLPAAVTHIHSLLAVAKTMEDQRQVISQLVRIAAFHTGFNTTWAALQKPGWTDAQLAELQAIWQLNEFPMAMVKSFEMERAMSLIYFEQLRSSKAARNKIIESQSKLVDFLGDGFDTMPTHGFLLHYVHIPAWRLAWAAQDELHALDRWQKIISGSRIAVAKSWIEAETLFPESTSSGLFGAVGFGSTSERLGWYDRCRFLFSNEPFSITGITMLKSLKSQTDQNMVLSAIALKRYELRHGKPASALSDLVPEFLPTMPIDFMDGKPLRYHREDSSNFKLYSVGSDGKDDNGNPEREIANDPSIDIWKGKDAVWPSLATETEVLEYQKRPLKKQ